jgi:hypothetical protein
MQQKQNRAKNHAADALYDVRLMYSDHHRHYSNTSTAVQQCSPAVHQYSNALLKWTPSAIQLPLQRTID